MTPMLWGASERDREIVRRYLAGESISVTGVDFGLSRQRIFQIVRKHKAARPKLPSILRLVPCAVSERIVELRESGLGYTSIAKQMEVHESTARQAVKRWRPDLAGRANRPKIRVMDPGA